MHYLNNSVFVQHWLLMMLFIASIFLIITYVSNNKVLFKKSFISLSLLVCTTISIYIFFPNIASPSLHTNINELSKNAISKAPEVANNILLFIFDFLSKGFRR